MRRTAVIVVAILAFSSAFAIGSRPVLADSGPPCRQMRGDRHPFAKWAWKLDLTKQQKQEIRGIFKENRPKFQPIMDKYLAERRDMRALVQAGKIDEPAIRQQATKLASTEADLAIQRAKMSSQIRAVLTPAQLEKFKALQAERDRRIDRFRDRMSRRLDDANPVNPEK